MTSSLDAGQWASILVQYLEDRNERALVRLLLVPLRTLGRPRGGRVSSTPPPSRPFRRGICDGDDVWPQSLTDADLRQIAAIDAETKRKEPERAGKLREILGKAPAFSLAERVRHWIHLVEDTETGANLHPGEYMTELGCRELVANKLIGVSGSLRQKLMSELLTPLDKRFEAATVDDGGAALAREVQIVDREDAPWWWNRRPAELGPLWKLRSG